MKKKILFILPCSLYPLESGGMQAIYNGIIAIKEAYDIFITYTTKATEENIERAKEFQNLMGNDSIRILPYFEPCPTQKPSLKRRIVNKLHHILDRVCPPVRRPYYPITYWLAELYPQPKPFIAHVNEIISRNQIDIVQSEMLCNLSFVQCLPASVKSVFVHHELGFVRHGLEIEAMQNEIYDGQSFLNCSKNLEISQLNQYDCVITLSPIDSQKLRSAGVNTDVRDSFAIVKQASAPLQNDVAELRDEIAFVGPDIHGPNVLGVEWFLENCWNKLLQQNPNYHFKIIGRWSDKKKAELSSQYKNLTFAGFVDDLAEALRGTVMIVPLTVGSGIRMKILEASTIGIPFISTSIGAEGIPLTSGTHCLIADNAEDFVNAIIRMKDSDLRKKCIQNAHQLVEEHYSMAALSRNRLDIYDSLLKEQNNQ